VVGQYCHHRFPDPEAPSTLIRVLKPAATHLVNHIGAESGPRPNLRTGVRPAAGGAAARLAAGISVGAPDRLGRKAGGVSLADAVRMPPMGFLGISR